VTRRRVGGKFWCIVAAVTALLAAGWYVLHFEMYQPLDANFDPLVQSARRAGYSHISDTATMKPCCFDAGEDRRVVLDKLNASGFKQEIVSGWVENFLGREHLGPRLQIFSRTATRFSCMDQFFIAVEFDEADQLVVSQGTWTNAACL
jgi:hypothetical protein